MKSGPDHEAELRKIVNEGLAVIVAGTGVSIASSVDPKTKQPHPQASWAGLLKHGIEWIREHKLIKDGVANAHLTLLEHDPRTCNFISAAEMIARIMGAPDSESFKEWLGDTIGSIKATERNVIDGLHAIRRQGNLLATTNYDSLLLDTGDGKQLAPVTWRDTGDFVKAFRFRDHEEKAIFLHGHWLRSSTVILDWKSYDEIARNAAYREDLAAAWKLNTWVYVGCGTSGIGDPDLGLLLERYGARARQDGIWDYCLVTNGQKEEVQAHFDERKLNIRAIAFGKKHSDLAGYLKGLVDDPDSPVEEPPKPSAEDAVPKPPDFYAVPDYIGSHQFVGRDAQLQEITDWAAASDPTNLLLFEAIGGNGKSMLTWEWTTKHATGVRNDWAGRFWYSFYEHGAQMAHFCRHALAYMAERPVEEFGKKHPAELRDALLKQLHAQPWLLVLDGLERVLVAYHRIDAAEIPDEEANTPTDKIVNRNPCDAIRDADNDFLRALSSVTPSKILVSSRLTPRVLLNPAGQPIPGVRRITLPGLRPPDAEALLRSCGIRGDSDAIRKYLAENCDNHPLVIGVLAGFIAHYLPNRGDFDQWAADPEGGAKLDLASLDIIQRRNHILRAALTDLSAPSRQLLSTLALISESVDYETLKAFSPHEPTNPAKLADTIRDIEQRGFLQYDGNTHRYDLHPVVRGVAAGSMGTEERDRYGKRVVDHFSALPHNPYEKAKTLEDLSAGLHVVRTLLKLGRFPEAARAYNGDLSTALLFNVEGYAEILTLLRPFFPVGWRTLPQGVDAWDGTHLANDAAIALRNSGESKEALAAHSVSLQCDLDGGKWSGASVSLCNIASALSGQNLLSKALRVDILACNVADATGDQEERFTDRLYLFLDQSRIGRRKEAEKTWQVLDPMGRAWRRAAYRPGRAECCLAQSRYWQGTLEEDDLLTAERLAIEGGGRRLIRELCRLRAAWKLEQGEWALAAKSFDKAVRMARERELTDAESEAGLALAKMHLGQLAEPRTEAERLDQLRVVDHRYLAMMWKELGDLERARRHALAAYKWAWADGEPYVDRFELTKATELLNELEAPIPVLPPYDPAKDEPFPWEAKVRETIEQLRAEKEAKKKAERRKKK